MRMTDIDRDAAQRAQNRVQNWFVIILLVDDVTDRARTSELQHERVHPTDMIRHKKKSAVWQVVEADRADSIKSAHEWAANGVEHTFSGRFRKHRL